MSVVLPTAMNDTAGETVPTERACKAVASELRAETLTELRGVHHVEASDDAR